MVHNWKVPFMDVLTTQDLEQIHQATSMHNKEINVKWEKTKIKHFTASIAGQNVITSCVKLNTLWNRLHSEKPGIQTIITTTLD